MAAMVSTTNLSRRCGSSGRRRHAARTSEATAFASAGAEASASPKAIVRWPGVEDGQRGDAVRAGVAGGHETDRRGAHGGAITRKVHSGAGAVPWDAVGECLDGDGGGLALAAADGQPLNEALAGIGGVEAASGREERLGDDHGELGVVGDSALRAAHPITARAIVLDPLGAVLGVDGVPGAPFHGAPERVADGAPQVRPAKPVAEEVGVGVGVRVV